MNTSILRIVKRILIISSTIVVVFSCSKLELVSRLEREIDSYGPIKSSDLPEPEPSIAYYNSDKDAIAMGARMHAGVYGEDTSVEFPMFLIVTDIHGNAADRNFKALERAFDYAREKDFVETVLCLGDIGDDSHYLVGYDWADKVLACGKPVLTVPGNHEFVYHTGQTEYLGLTDSELFEKLYSDTLVINNGEIHGGVDHKKNYWYKDISKTGYDNVTRKIRIIGLYQYELSEPDEDGNSVSRYKASGLYTQEQVEWFISVLDSVEENMYVLVLTHSPVIGLQPRIVENPFSPTIIGWPSKSYQMAESNRDFLSQVVNAWVTGVNGTFTDSFSYGDAVSVTTNFKAAHHKQFICFICGHAHTDFVVKHSEYNLCQVMLNCTAVDQNQQASDIPRQYSGKTMDCVTLFTYDWFDNQVRLIRLGSDVTIDMRERKYSSIKL